MLFLLLSKFLNQFKAYAICEAPWDSKRTMQQWRQKWLPDGEIVKNHGKWSQDSLWHTLGHGVFAGLAIRCRKNEQNWLWAEQFF